MKKLFLSLVAAIVAATATYAQSSLVATLSHEGVTTAYYGVNAFSQAYSAAADGDVITLSPGTFSAVNIYKAVVIRGAGMKTDTVKNRLRTTILGEFTIVDPSQTTNHRLSMEGLYINDDICISKLTNASFIKCRFAKISYGYQVYPKWEKLSFVNCLITTAITLYEGSVFCKNCYVRDAFVTSSSNNPSFEFTNCIIINDEEPISYSNATEYVELYDIRYSSFYNCIIYGASTSTGGSVDNILPSSNVASYCIGFTKNDTNVFSNIPTYHNTEVKDDFYTIFEDFTGPYTDDVTFKLTDNAKSKYKGHDGTEVGIYGGELPYNPTSSIPQITQFDVEKNAANGKLTVKINVE